MLVSHLNRISLVPWLLQYRIGMILELSPIPISYQYRYWPCIYLTWDWCQTLQYHTPQPNRGIEATQLKKYKRQEVHPSNPMACLFGRGLWYVNRFFFSRLTCFKFDGHVKYVVCPEFLCVNKPRMSLLSSQWIVFVCFVFFIKATIELLLSSEEGRNKWQILC